MIELKKLINKIDYRKVFKSISEFIKNNSTVILFFLVIFLLLFFQHDVVSMYFDDYGNASLSYSYVTPDVSGTNYTLAQLWEWAINVYNNFGGRIFYAISFIIPLLKHGISLFMHIQAVIITLIMFVSYKIVSYKSSNKKFNLLVPIMLFILYSLINMVYLRHGIYWASASVLYIWPILPMVTFMYLYIKVIDHIKNKEKFNYVLNILGLLLTSFLTVFSQEQFGIALVLFILSYAALNHFKSFKNYLKIDIPVLVNSTLWYLVLFLAPGNWVRMSSNTTFAALNFFEKIKYNYPKIIINIFYDKMTYFIIAILLIGIVMAIKNYLNNNIKNKGLNVLWLGFNIIIYVIQFIILPMESRVSATGHMLLIIMGTITLISLFVTSLIYFYNNKHMEYCSYEVAAFGSIFCLLMSPTTGGRTGLPFIFIIFIIITKCFLDFLNDKNKIFAVLIFILVLYAGYMGYQNYRYIYKGYLDNYPINKLNDEILKSYDATKDGNTLTLYKVEDSWFGSNQSYEEPTMNYWICEYYNISHEVTFKWVDIYERFR